MPAVRGDQQLFTEVVQILVTVCGEGPGWATAIGFDSRLEGDLRMDSIEFSALGQALDARYGDRIRLEQFLADKEMDELIGLTVADVVSHVAARRVSDSNPGQAPR